MVKRRGGQLEDAGFHQLPVQRNDGREDLELRLIAEERFDFVNRRLLESALQEMELCNGMECFMEYYSHFCIIH